MKHWITFIRERFPLTSHLTMIFLFVGCHSIAAHSADIQFSPTQFGLIFLSILIFFFKMRLYDEIKDFELDVKVNPSRPLPRGLLSLGAVKKGIWLSIGLELILFSFLGWQGLLVLSFAVAYSLLMYKEFFIPDLIRPHLTTYAMSHTIVTIPMGLAIFCGLAECLPWQLSPSLILFAVCSWPLFNIFEFGRKTFAESEERSQVESYSKIFGRFGAVFLVKLMAVFAMTLIFFVMGKTSWVQLAIFTSLFLVGNIFAFKNSISFAKIYRNFSSFYIVLFYICYAVESYLSGTQ